ncbi:MAG TPA: M20/M25/M40 family metallo-hydrolase, partial [Gemmatimonadales bacterium]|nr:M20/M25/M40 family metallo-hydrolase [Gemmatimonadales bacterium]
MRPLTPLLALALLLPTAAAAQGGAAPGTAMARALSPAAYMAHLRYLSDDALEGRAPGTRGGDLAAKYIASQFERLGLTPAGDSGTWYHRVPIITLDPTPTLSYAAGSAPAAPLTYKTDYVAWSMRNDTLVAATAPLVFVGYGITAPEWQWADFDGVDVKGKIIVVLVNDPGLHDPAIFRGKELTYYGRWTYKIEEAARQGAAGILLVHTEENATYGWGTVVGSWTGGQVRLETPPTPLRFAGWLTHDAAARLFAAGGQDLDALSAQAGRHGFHAVPLGVTMAASIRSTVVRSSTVNVVARRPGTGTHRDEAVLVGGHYDHLGFGPPVNGDSIYNGAADNASGVAGVLTLAEAAVRSNARTDRSLIFMAFGAEESGLLGSGAFVQRPTLPLKRIAGVINIDEMVLLGRTRDIGALGVDQSSLGPVFTTAARQEGLRVVTDPDAALKGFFFRSDHFPFVNAGIPSLSLEGGSDFVGRPAGWGKAQAEEYNNDRYHQPSDELLPNYTPDGALQELRVVARTMAAVANAPRMPTWD